jgi:hypothetical protein
MKKVAVVAALAVMLIGASAGVVVAQVTANPSSDVLYDPDLAHFGTAPSEYAEGVTIQHINTTYSAGCQGEGIVTTTRLGDMIVQEVVLTAGYEPGVGPGDHCSRSGSASGWWDSGFQPNTN